MYGHVSYSQSRGAKSVTEFEFGMNFSTGNTSTQWIVYLLENIAYSLLFSMINKLGKNKNIFLTYNIYKL